MAIQNRRGSYTYFDPTKMVPGEFAVVQTGDPDSTSGVALYLCFSSGTVKRITTEEDLEDALDAYTVSWTNVSNKPTPDTSLSHTGQFADAGAVGTQLNILANDIALPYNSSGTYAIGSYCIYQRKLYKCIVPITSSEAWNASHWLEVKIVDLIKNVITEVEQLVERLWTVSDPSNDGNVVISMGN